MYTYIKKQYKNFFKLVLILNASLIFCIIAWYAVSFLPHVSKLNSVSERTSLLDSEILSELYLLSITRETEGGVRAYAMKQAYRSLSLDPKGENNTLWHANSLLWYFASYLHFNNQEVFGLWVDCSIYGCGQGLPEASLRYYGENINNLSQRQLASLVLLVRNPKQNLESERSKQQIYELLKTVKEE